MEKYDVIIIGAGVTGTAVARELSRYQIKTCVLEREEDVCCGTSKANSAIIHAGYDAEPGTLKAKLNVRGNLLIGELAEKLDFPFKRNGSFVLCLDEKDYQNLQKLYEKGITNGVKKLRILNHDEVLEMGDNACFQLRLREVGVWRQSQEFHHHRIFHEFQSIALHSGCEPMHLVYDRLFVLRLKQAVIILRGYVAAQRAHAPSLDKSLVGIPIACFRVLHIQKQIIVSP